MSKPVCENLFLGLLRFQSSGCRFSGTMNWSSCIVFCAVVNSALMILFQAHALLSIWCWWEKTLPGMSKIFILTLPNTSIILMIFSNYWGLSDPCYVNSVSNCRNCISQRGVKLVLNFGWLQKRSNTPEIKEKYFPRTSSKGTPFGWKYSKGHTEWKKPLQRPELPIFRISVLTTSNSLFEQTSLVVPVSLYCLLSVYLGNFM